MAGVSHVPVHAQLDVGLQLWRACRYSVPHRVQACLFQISPSLNILHIRISGGRKGYVSLVMRNILNFAGEELAERHKLSLGMNWAHTLVPGNTLLSYVFMVFGANELAILLTHLRLLYTS